jgi:hypothetical protein
MKTSVRTQIQTNPWFYRDGEGKEPTNRLESRAHRAQSLRPHDGYVHATLSRCLRGMQNGTLP